MLENMCLGVLFWGFFPQKKNEEIKITITINVSSCVGLFIIIAVHKYVCTFVHSLIIETLVICLW